MYLVIDKTGGGEAFTTPSNTASIHACVQCVVHSVYMYSMLYTAQSILSPLFGLAEQVYHNLYS